MIIKFNQSAFQHMQYEIVKKFITRENRFACIVLPRRAGKSVLSYYIASAICLSSRCSAAIFAPEQRQVKRIYMDNILNDGRRLLSLIPSECFKGGNIQKALNRTDCTLTFANGSILYFLGSDRYDSVVGSNFKFIAMDEFSVSKPESLEYFMPMVVRNNGSLMILGTPRGQNHLYERFNSAKNNNDWITKYANVFDLGLMTQAEYDAIDMDDGLKQQEFLCSWQSPFQNSVYTNPNITKPIQYRGGVYIALDLGIDDPTAVLFACKHNDKLVILDGFECTRTALDAVELQIKKVMQDKGWYCANMFLPFDSRKADDVITGGYSRYEYLMSKGYNCSIVKREGLMDGIDLLRQNWHNIAFVETATHITDKIRSYVLNDKTFTPKHDSSSHVADALRYLFVGLKQNEGINAVDISKIARYSGQKWVA